MAFPSANHFVLSGAGVEGVVDITGLYGDAVVSLNVDGHVVLAPDLESTRQGIMIRGVLQEIPDAHTLLVAVTIPEINLDTDSVTAAGFAVLITEQSSIAGPGLIRGPLQLFDLRPLTVTGSIVES